MFYLGVSAFICGLTVVALPAENGRKLYEDYCLACHYRDGSPGHGGAVKFGVPGSQMPGFADLSEDQRRALAKHVIDLNQRARKKQK